MHSTTYYVHVHVLYMKTSTLWTLCEIKVRVKQEARGEDRPQTLYPCGHTGNGSQKPEPLLGQPLPIEQENAVSSLPMGLRQVSVCTPQCVG